MLNIKIITENTWQEINLNYFSRPNGRFMNETKEYILKTSLLLFLQKSYKEVTMREIVDKTGLSKGAFYHYFASKEELFKEILHLMMAMGNTNYQEYPKDSLYSFYQYYIQMAQASHEQLNQLFGENSDGKLPFNFFLILFEAMTKYPEFLEMEYAQYESGLVAWSEVIKIAKERGEINSNSTEKEIADLFLLSTDGSFIRFLNHPAYQGTYIEYLSSVFSTIYNNLST